MLRSTIAIVIVTLTASFDNRLLACGFVELEGNTRTLRTIAADSDFIARGYLREAHGKPGDGTTDFVIVEVVKGVPLLRGRRLLTVESYMPAEENEKSRAYLVFGSVKEGKLRIARAEPGGTELVRYLQGLLAYGASNRTAALTYCFRYLDHPLSEIALDAYREFVVSTDPEISRAARLVSPVMLRKWLADPKTPTERLRLYGFLLGNCGIDQDAELLRDVVQRLNQTQQSPWSMDGILSGYVLLRPKEGLILLRNNLQDPLRPFSLRYATLRAVRFFNATRPDVLAEQDRVELMATLAQHPDCADFAIDALRSWQRWEQADRVFDLWSRKSHDAGIIRRAIMQYALDCPGRRAELFVGQRFREDHEYVEEAMEVLRFVRQTARNGS